MAVVISVAALIVSAVTLWLTQLRRGKLVAPAPKIWAGRADGRTATLTFPLAISNTGSRTAVVRDLRLRFDGEDEPYDWIRTRPEIHPERGKPSFAAPFVVPGRSAVVMFCEFEREPGREPEAGSWLVHVEAQTLDHPDRWRDLVSFRWGVAPGDDGSELSRFRARLNYGQS